MILAFPQSYYISPLLDIVHDSLVSVDKQFDLTLLTKVKYLNSAAKFKRFKNMVTLHIKLKLTSHAATWKQILCTQTHPRPRGGVKRSNQLFFFSESSHDAYQIKENWG